MENREQNLSSIYYHLIYMSIHRSKCIFANDLEILFIV